MEIVVAWLTLFVVFGLIAGLVYPPLALPFTKDKTRGKALVIYGYALFVTLALGVVFIRGTNLESRLFVLFFFCLIALGAGLIYPPLVLPWKKDPVKKSVALFYLAPAVLLTLAMFYTKVTVKVDPRYDLSQVEIAEASPERLIEYTAASVLKGENNMGQPRVRRISVEESRGGYEVSVEYNTDDVMFKGLFKLQLKADMTKIYKALYTSGYDIDEVTVSAFMLEGGRESDTPPELIGTTSLDKEQAQGVDWDEKTHVLEAEVLPKAWNEEYMHPEYE